MPRRAYLLLEEGKKIEADAISTHCGGGAVNAAVCFARLGWDAAALVKLGQDARADQILTRLGEEGVSTRFASRDARLPTGASVLVSAHDRNAAVFAFRGANTLLEPHDLKADAFGVDLVNVSGLSNKSAECFPLIVAKAKAAKAKLAVNPGRAAVIAAICGFPEAAGRYRHSVDQPHGGRRAGRRRSSPRRVRAGRSSTAARPATPRAARLSRRRLRDHHGALLRDAGRPSASSTSSSPTAATALMQRAPTRSSIAPRRAGRWRAPLARATPSSRPSRLS